MTPRVKKLQLAVFIIAVAVLAAVWAINGFESTWLYAALVLVVVPNSWWVELVNKLIKKNK